MPILDIRMVRHAKPINPDKICYVWEMKVDLSDRKALGSLLAKLPVGSKWYASPVPRTAETARALTSMRALASGPEIIELRPNLREQSFGAWDGMRHEDLRKNPLFLAYMDYPAEIAPPAGENMADFAHRVQGDIGEVIAAHQQGGNCVFIVHAGTIRAVFAEASGMPIEETRRIDIDPLSLTHFTYDTDKKSCGKNPWKIKAVNITPLI